MKPKISKCSKILSHWVYIDFVRTKRPSQIRQKEFLHFAQLKDEKLFIFSVLTYIQSSYSIDWKVIVKLTTTDSFRPRDVFVSFRGDHHIPISSELRKKCSGFFIFLKMHQQQVLYQYNNPKSPIDGSTNKKGKCIQEDSEHLKLLGSLVDRFQTKISF